jgi:hypothetical protein
MGIRDAERRTEIRVDFVRVETSLIGLLVAPCCKKSFDSWPGASHDTVEQTGGVEAGTLAEGNQ